jgi:hypothetical protein
MQDKRKQLKEVIEAHNMTIRLKKKRDEEAERATKTLKRIEELRKKKQISEEKASQIREEVETTLRELAPAFDKNYITKFNESISAYLERQVRLAPESLIGGDEKEKILAALSSKEEIEIPREIACRAPASEGQDEEVENDEYKVDVREVPSVNSRTFRILAAAIDSAINELTKVLDEVEAFLDEAEAQAVRESRGRKEKTAPEEKPSSRQADEPLSATHKKTEALERNAKEDVPVEEKQAEKPEQKDIPEKDKAESEEEAKKVLSSLYSDMFKPDSGKPEPVLDEEESENPHPGMTP